MKILIENHAFPFFLAHGGEQIQILRTFDALKANGVDVELTRWWDGSQVGDLIHCFGTPDLGYVRMAQKKGMAVLNTTLFTATCNRSHKRLNWQGRIVKSLLSLPPIPPWSLIRNQLRWESFRECDSNIVGIDAEKDVLQTVYGVNGDNIQIVPLGLADEFLNAGRSTRDGDYLITTGTITERKRSLELAEMARGTKTPIYFVGKPYDQTDPYWKQFERMIDGKYVRHLPHTENVDQLIRLLQRARGYVLYSDYENWCLAAHEAIACGLPILVPDQRWSRERFGGQASYFSATRGAHDAGILRSFYKNSSFDPAPDIPLLSWNQVGQRLTEIYGHVIRNRKSPGRNKFVDRCN
jgi:glycosyltransferase involved in cell wall biosynthesis